MLDRKLFELYVHVLFNSNQAIHDPAEPANGRYARIPPQSRPPPERQPLWRLHEGAALRGEDTERRLRLPAARHAQRPLPLPRWQEHGGPHGCGPRPLRPRPPQPWLLQRRDRRAAPRGQHPPPPQPRPARRPPRLARWTWGGSLEIAIDRRGGPVWPPHVRATARAPTWGRPCNSRSTVASRWTWGASLVFAVRPRRHPPPRPLARIGAPPMPATPHFTPRLFKFLR